MGIAAIRLVPGSGSYPAASRVRLPPPRRYRHGRTPDHEECFRQLTTSIEAGDARTIPMSGAVFTEVTTGASIARAICARLHTHASAKRMRPAPPAQSASPDNRGTSEYLTTISSRLCLPVHQDSLTIAARPM